VAGFEMWSGLICMSGLDSGFANFPRLYWVRLPVMEIPMAMHRAQHASEAASDDTMHAMYLGAALCVVAVIALWYFS